MSKEKFGIPKKIIRKFMTVNPLTLIAMERNLNYLRFATFAAIVCAMYWSLCKYFLAQLDFTLFSLEPTFTAYVGILLKMLATVVVGCFLFGTASLLVARLNPYDRGGRLVVSGALSVAVLYCVFKAVCLYFAIRLNAERYLEASLCSFVMFIAIGLRAAASLTRQRYA
jgi:hypothetical protein